MTENTRRALDLMDEAATLLRAEYAGTETVSFMVHPSRGRSVCLHGWAGEDFEIGRDWFTAIPLPKEVA